MNEIQKIAVAVDANGIATIAKTVVYEFPQGAVSWDGSNETIQPNQKKTFYGQLGTPPIWKIKRD
ncbi:MAG TPA: hypothetical protein VMC08_03635 [Bacteroidales bacterium]|nr:hypothetical protein [Bacteroidales bacterium]